MPWRDTPVAAAVAVQPGALSANDEARKWVSVLQQRADSLSLSNPCLHPFGIDPHPTGVTLDLTNNLIESLALIRELPSTAIQIPEAFCIQPFGATVRDIRTFLALPLPRSPATLRANLVQP